MTDPAPPPQPPEQPPSFKWPREVIAEWIYLCAEKEFLATSQVIEHSYDQMISAHRKHQLQFFEEEDLDTIQVMQLSARETLFWALGKLNVWMYAGLGLLLIVHRAWTPGVF